MNVKLNFWIDIATFVGFLVAFEPRATGITIHEWFTVTAVGTLIVHFILHWDWFMKLTSRFFVKLFHSSRLNYMLAILNFIGFTAIIVSGLMISEHVMPFFGIEFQRNFAWRGIHEFASNATFALVAIHVALRWEWVKAAFTKILIDPFKRRSRDIDSVLSEEDGI